MDSVQCIEKLSVKTLFNRVEKQLKKSVALLMFFSIVDAMSVRMKLTHSKTASRRAHHKKGTPHLVATKTGVRRRHFVDTDTGMYRGKQIITIGKKVDDKAVASAKPKKAEKKGTTSKEENAEKK
jgi:ribosomal protein L32